jgi:hypothetical protein
VRGQPARRAHRRRVAKGSVLEKLGRFGDFTKPASTATASGH